MSKTVKALTVAMGVALLLGALGIGAAFAQDPPTAADSPTNYRAVFLGKVARILGIDEQKVTSAFAQAAKETRNERIDKALAEGRISREWADWLKAAPDDGAFGPGFRGRHGWGGIFGRLGQPKPGPGPAPLGGG